MNSAPLSATPLIDAQLTGQLAHNSQRINEQAVRELVATNPYWLLNSRRVRDHGFTFEEGLKVLTASYGPAPDDHSASDVAYIDPQTTARQLMTGVNALRLAARQHATFLFATGHPGSMLELYHRLSVELRDLGGHIWQLDARRPAPEGRFIDQVGGVLVLSDEGSLIHTHAAEGVQELFAKERPDWIIADHGFACAADNEDIATVAFFDTDDPAIALAASLHDTLIAIPMNDNQTNVLTARAVMDFLRAGHVN